MLHIGITSVHRTFPPWTELSEKNYCTTILPYYYIFVFSVKFFVVSFGLKNQLVFTTLLLVKSSLLNSPRVEKELLIYILVSNTEFSEELALPRLEVVKVWGISSRLHRIKFLRAAFIFPFRPIYNHGFMALLAWLNQ